MRVVVVCVVELKLWPPSNTDPPLLFKQMVDVSVVLRRQSLRRFVVTRTYIGRTDPEGCRLSFSPFHCVSKQTAIFPYHGASCLHVRWVQMDGKTIDFIGNYRESASSTEHAQVMRRATNTGNAMYKQYGLWHITLDIGAVGPCRCCFRSSNFDRKSARAFTLSQCHQRSIDLRP